MERQAKHCAKKGRWSRGMIPPLSGGGLGSDSPSAAPYFFACTFHVHQPIHQSLLNSIKASIRFAFAPHFHLYTVYYAVFFWKSYGVGNHFHYHRHPPPPHTHVVRSV